MRRLRFSLWVLSVFIIPACSGSRTAAAPLPSVQIKGNAQKGPMIVGSSVDAHTLDGNLAPTGAVFSTQLLSDLGTFDFTRSFHERFLEVVVNGFFYDELTATLSGAPLTLRALTDTRDAGGLHVNIGTTLAKNRILELVGQGMSFAAAAAQAKLEVFGVFKIDAGAFGDLNGMDITGNTAGDLALIAVSAILLQYAADRAATPGQKVAELSLVLSALAADLATDGAVTSAVLLHDLAVAARRLNVPALRANLEAIYAGQGIIISVGDPSPYIDPMAAEQPWRFSTSLPEIRGSPAGTAAGGKIYVIGGIDSTGSSTTADVYEFDPLSESWSLRAAMPTPRFLHTCAELNGHVFAIGGRDLLSNIYLTSVEEYDPVADSWSTRAPLPSPRNEFCSASVGGRIYVFGGGDGSVLETNTVYEFDPVGNSWQTRAPMPTARSQAGCAVAGGKIYVVGGSAASGRTDVVEEYDPVGNTWVPRKSLDAVLAGPSVASLNGKIYAIAGSPLLGEPMVKWTQEYDPATNTWLPKTPCDIARFKAVAAVLNGEIYIIGSSTIAPVTTAVEAYDPSKDD